MPRKARAPIFEDVVPYKDSFLQLAESLTEADVDFYVGSFEEFVQNVFAKSFPKYNFNVWHVHQICHRADLVFQKRENPYLLAALPRGHLKSTVLGYASTIYRMLTAFGDGLYVSVTGDLCEYHLSNVKAIVRDNELLSKTLIDMRSDSNSGVYYKLGPKRMRMFGEGILSAQRGRHFDLIAVADDLLGDLENPLALGELEKAKRLFKSEVLPTLNPGCPFFVFGTVIDYSDLIFELKDNPLFEVIWYSAINPDAIHNFLWEERFNKKVLDDIKTVAGWKAFSTEYLLIPLRSMEAFLSREQLDPVINSKLVNYQVPGVG